MVRQYRKFDEDFKSGAVRLVFEIGKPIAQVARDMGVNEGTLGNWVAAARRPRDGGDGPPRDGGDGPPREDERAELARLRRENAELRIQHDVLERSVHLWVDEAMGRQPSPPLSPPRGTSTAAQGRRAVAEWIEDHNHD